MAKVFGAVTTLNRDLMHSMARGPGPVVKQKWESDYQKALSRSATTGRPVLAACTGIPWCGPCLALEAEVFKSWKFNAWAAGQVVLLSLNDPDAEPPTP